MRKCCFRNVKIRKILMRNVFSSCSAVIYSNPCCGYCCATLFTKTCKLPSCRTVSSTISLQCCSLLKSPGNNTHFTPSFSTYCFVSFASSSSSKYAIAIFAPSFAKAMETARQSHYLLL